MTDTMTNSTKSLKRFYRFSALTLICLSLQTHAACKYFDKFQDNKNGTVTDPRSGLIWKRCAENFEWTGKECKGSKKTMDWIAAMQTARQSQFLGMSDWRIPTKAEFDSVLGPFNDCQGDNYKKGIYAASRMIAHTVNGTNGAMDGNIPAGVFWSSSPSKFEPLEAWDADFTFGYVGESKRRYSRNVRLVRSIAPSGSEARLEFNTEYAKIEQYQNQIKKQ